jgi:hypothetical protein
MSMAITPEQEVKLVIVRTLIDNGVPIEKVKDFATILSEWIFGHNQSLPCSTDDKV